MKTKSSLFRIDRLLIAALALLAAPHVHAQVTTNVFFFEDFNEPNSTSLGSATNTNNSTSYAWLEGGSGGTNNARIAIVSSNLVISNTTPAGRDWAYVALTNTSGFNTTYSSSTATSLEWYVNMRQSRTDPSGFGNAAYGAAFIIGASSTNFTGSGVTGYALLYGQSGATDPLRFVYFTNGLAADSSIVNVITATNTGADIGNQFLSLRLNYNVASNSWSLFGTTNASFVDPWTNSSLASYGTASNSTYTGTSLSFMGAFYNYATAAGETASFDNIRVASIIEAIISALNWIGGSGNWSDGFGGTVTNGSALSFSGAGGIATNNLVAPLIASMTFSNGAGSYTIAGNAFTISNNIVNNSASLQTFSNNITLGASQSFSASAGAMTFAGNIDTGVNVLNIAGSSNTIVSGVISGSAGLTKSGLGTLTLNNANTFTGNITNNGGVISVDNDSELGNSANDIVFGGLGTGTLQTTASFAMAAGRDISGTGALDIASGTTLTNSGTVNMTALTLANTGTFEMSGASKTLNGLTFSVASALTNTGAAAVIGGNVAANNASGTVVMAGAYDLGTTNRIFTVSNGSATTDMQITGSITNTNPSGYLIKAGAGRLEISGNNSGLAGGLQLGTAGSAAAGELVVTSKEAFGRGQFRLNSGTFIASTALTGANAITNNLSIGGRAANAAIIGGANAVEFTGAVSWFGAASTASTLQVNNATTLSGVIASGNTNGVTFEFAGTGSLTLSGASGNTFTNAVTISNTGLTVIVGKNDAFGTTAAGTTLQSGSTILLNGVNYSTAEALTINGTGIGGSGALRSSGSSTFAGVVTAGATATIAADAGSTLTLSGGISGGANTVTVGGAGDVIVSGAISSGNISKGGNGNLTISNTNSSFGTLTTGTGNTVIATNTSITGLAGSGALNLAGGDLTLSNSANQSFSGAISGAGNFYKDGTGTVTLSGASSHSGETWVIAGTLAAGANNVLSSNSIHYVGFDQVRGVLDLNSSSQTIASLFLYGATTPVTNTVLVGSGGILTVNGDIQYESVNSNYFGAEIVGGTLDLAGRTNTFLVFSNGNTVATRGGDLKISSVITNGSIIKSGSGILNLTAANTFSGTISNSAGTLALGNVDALQNATLDAGAAGTQLVDFVLAGNNTYNIGALTGADNIVLGANRISVGGNNANSTYSGILSGTGGLTKAGNGTFTLSGANSYSGGTVVSGGRLVGSTATLQGAITNTAAVTFNQSTNGTYGNVMSGVGGTLTKSGLGTLTMTNANTFSGATTIEAGRLLVNGTNANSAVTVNSSASLGGSGRVGDLTVSGLLAPGNSIGTLSAGNTTFNTNAFFELEIYNFGGTAGTDWDRFIVDSTLTLSNTTANPFTINLVSMSSSTTAGAALFNPNLSYTNQFVNYTTLSGSFDASAFNVSLLNFTNFTAINGTFSITNTGTGLALLYLTSYVPPSVFDWNTGSGEWSDNNAWAGSVAPTDGADISFSGAGGQSTNNTITSIAGLTFSNGAGSYTISGTAAMTNGSGGIVNNSANNQTINNDLILGAVQTFNAASGDITIGGAVDNNGNSLTVDGAANVALNGAISDAGGVTKIGSGSLTLGGNNTFTGTLAANAGTVLVTGTQATTTINVGGGTLLLGASDVLANGATVALTTGTVNFGSFSDTITTFNQSGGVFTNGTLTATTYGLSGGTVGGTLGAGTANVTGAVSLSGVINSTLNINSGGTLTLAANDRIGNSSAVTVNAGTLATATFNDTVGSVVLTNSGSLTGSGTITAGTYTLNGGTVSANLGTGTATSSAGTTTLNGTLAGDLAVSGGTLTLGGADRLANSSAVTVSSGTLNFGSFTDAVGSFSLSGGVFTNGTVTTTTYSLSGGTVGGTLGAGTANVTGGVTLSGVIDSTLNINTGGTLTLAAADRINNSSAVTLAGGTLNLGGFSDTVGSFSITGGAFNNGTLTAATYGLGGGTVGGNLGAGTINATGSTTLNGTAAATTVNVSGSTLTLGSAGRLAAGATVNVTNSGTLAIAGAESVTSLVLSNGTLGGAGQTLTAGSYALQGGTVTANLGAGTATASVGTTAINGNLGGALTASGGTANLNGTVAGNVTVSGGDVNLGSANRIADTATVAVSSGALNLGANNDSVRTVQITGGSITGSGVLTATSNYDVQGGTISAAIGGSAAMTKSGAATATISGNNSTYSGAVTVGSGALLAANNNAFGTAAITVTNGSTLAASGVTLANNFTIGSVGGLTTNAFVSTNIAAWDFNGLSAYGSSPLAPTTNASAGVSIVGLTRGSGVGTSGTAAGNAWGGSDWSTSTNPATAISGGDFATFAVTISNGFALNLTNFAAYNVRRSSSGPATGLWQWSTNGTDFSDIGSAITWGNVTSGSAGNPQNAISFTNINGLQGVAAGTTVTFRVVNYGASGTGTWYLNDPNATSGLDFLVNGQIATVTSNAAGGSGTLGISEAGTATFSGNIANNAAATFTAASGGTATFSGIVSGAGTLNKTGAGTVTLSGASANTFTGTTTVSAGTLQLNKTADVTALSSTNLIVSKVDNDNRAVLLLSANNQVADTTAVTLSGGTIRRSGDVSEIFGSLNLTEASFLDYGADNAAGTLTFASDYTPSALLTVQNFLPGNKLQFGSTISSADLNNASLFSFSNGFTTGTEGGYFTITAIPEPSTYIAAAVLIGLMVWPSRKRLLKDAKKILGLRAPMRDRLVVRRISDSV